MNNDHDSQLDLERIKLLYGSGHLTLVGFAIGLVALAFAVGNSLPASSIAGWIVLTLISLLPRIVLKLSFKNKISRDELAPDDAIEWEKWWALSATFPAMAFVSLAYFPFQENEFIAVMFVGLVIHTLCAASVITSITSRISVRMFLSLSCLPYIVRCYSEGTELYLILGTLSLCYYFMLIQLSARLNHTVLTSISLQIESRADALIDSLTGLWNRRGLYPYADQLIRQTRRKRERFSIIMLDIDHFKRTNDTLGHTAGDDILVNVADCIRYCSRDGDMLVRYGGEEFLMILPSTTLDNAGTVAERIISTVREKTATTISAGVAEYDFSGDFDELVGEADRALYQAKGDGRDRVVIARKE